MVNELLKAFIQVADCGSFNKAAEKLYLSPTAVMKQMNQLESQLGLILFVRTNHGLKLTEAGKVIHREARYLVKHSEKALAEARTLAGSSQQIRIGTSPLRSGGSIMPLLQEVNRLYPGWQVKIVPFDDERDNYKNILTHMGEEIDVVAGLFPSITYREHCNMLELERFPLSCAVSLKHPLAQKKKLRIEDLYGEKLIVVERGDSNYIDALREELEQKHPLIEIVDVPRYDIRTFNQCESMGGIMITAENWRDVHPLLVTIPVEWEFYIPYGLIYPLRPSGAVAAFMEAVRTIVVSRTVKKKGARGMKEDI